VFQKAEIGAQFKRPKKELEKMASIQDKFYYRKKITMIGV
jgi:hypothetical protein